MNINIKKLTEDAVAPTRATDGSAGYDLTVLRRKEVTIRDAGNCIGTYSTGIALEIPQGYVGLVVERSSLHKKGFKLANTVGVIDSDYRDELMIKLSSNRDIIAGGRVAQLLVVKAEQLEFSEVKNLSKTSRNGGFGSTDS